MKKLESLILGILYNSVESKQTTFVHIKKIKIHKKINKYRERQGKKLFYLHKCQMQNYKIKKICLYKLSLLIISKFNNLK